MDVLELKAYPDPCLRVQTKRVDVFDSDLKDLLSLMSDEMYKSGGIGLAATQVGVGLSVFVIDVGDGIQMFVNPEIIEASAKKTRLEEGCLSLPGITVGVRRPEKVKVRAYNGDGKMFTRAYDGIAAKAVQHEMDHLKGKLIIDHLNPVKYFFATRELSAKVKGKTGGKCEVVCRVGKTDK
jgi:peptide deformylase